MQRTSPKVTEMLPEVLHTGLGETNLLGSMLQKFGKAFFWDCFGHILSAVQGKLLPGESWWKSKTGQGSLLGLVPC